MEEEESRPSAISMIECTECNTKWQWTDIHRGNSADTCKCGNIMLGILDMTPPTRRPNNFFITVKYKTTYPNIYDIKIED